MKSAITTRFSKNLLTFEKVAVAILLLIGIALRFRQYLIDRSLWADEAMLALNIINRNFAGMFQPLDLNQGAPIGFLLVEKLFNLILGRNEFVLRFFPLIAGIASLWLFYLLLKQVTQKAGIIIALALFAVNPQLVYYSSESKQYIVDVAITVGLLLLAMPIFQQQGNKRDYTLLGAAGIFALWLSHPALFVLAGIGFALLIQLLQKRDNVNLRRTILIGTLWVLNFILLYFINLRQLRGNSFLTEYWADAFMPVPPWSDPGWFVSFFKESVPFQLGIKHFPWLVVILVLTGWIALYRETRPIALTFAFITIFAFAASALQLYPVKGRLVLFMIPLEVILLGKTVELAQKFWASNRAASVAISLALSGFMIYSPFVTSARTFITPKYFEHIRPYMEYLSASWKDGDLLFVSYWAEPAFRYYAPFYHLENIHYESSYYEDYSDPQKLRERFEPLMGKKRVWVLFSHVYEQGNFNEKDFLIAYLDEVGKQTRQLRIPNTSVHLFLYDLSK